MVQADHTCLCVGKPKQSTRHHKMCDFPLFPKCCLSRYATPPLESYIHAAGRLKGWEDLNYFVSMTTGSWISHFDLKDMLYHLHLSGISAQSSRSVCLSLPLFLLCISIHLWFYLGSVLPLRSTRWKVQHLGFWMTALCELELPRVVMHVSRGENEISLCALYIVFQFPGNY